MTTQDAVIFIDAQLFIDLYRTESGKDLLALIRGQQPHIFITEQIVHEVNKHKLAEAMKFFQAHCQIRPVGCKLPNHLFDEDGRTVQGIREALRTASAMVTQATHDLEEAIANTLYCISTSTDVVSVLLAPLFAGAVAHKAEELERARVRNIRGILPGKQASAIGDELNWEQFLCFVKEKGKRRIWIVSRDSDYCLKNGMGGAFLQPCLHQELMRLTDAPHLVRAFTNIPDAIQDFCDATGIEATNLPDPDRVEEIKKEQERLPPLGWVPGVRGSPPLGSTTTTPIPMGSGSGAYYQESGSGAYYQESGSGGYYPESGTGSGSGYDAQSPGYWPASGSYSGFESGSPRERLQVYWGDGIVTPMHFDGKMWRGPTRRPTRSGGMIPSPLVEVRDDAVVVDGTRYPIQRSYPFLANVNHCGTKI